METEKTISGAMAELAAACAKAGYNTVKWLAGYECVPNRDGSMLHEYLIDQGFIEPEMVQVRVTDARWKYLLTFAGAASCAYYLRKYYKARYALPPPPLITNSLAAQGTRPKRPGFEPESIREGSDMRTQNVPKCQARVAVKNPESGTYQVVASGVRIENALVFPSHVGQDAYILSNVKGAGERMIALDDKRKVIETDMEYAELNEEQFSQLGMSKMPVGVVNKRAMVSITSSVDGAGCVNELTPRLHSFGTVEFHGSTVPGCSGAAYMEGRNIVGIHLRGGTINGGFEAGYILALLKLDMGIVNESNDPVSTDPGNKGEDGEYNGRTKNTAWKDLGPDERYGGRKHRVVGREPKGYYHHAFVMSDEVSDLLEAGLDWATTMELYGAPDQRVPESSHMTVGPTFSGEFQGPSAAPTGSRPHQVDRQQRQALSASDMSHVSELIKQAGLSERIKQLSKKQLIALRDRMASE